MRIRPISMLKLYFEIIEAEEASFTFNSRRNTKQISVNLPWVGGDCVEGDIVDGPASKKKMF